MPLTGETEIPAATNSVDEAFRAWSPQLPVGVACSGGGDSVALLHLCARRWPGEVVALHVNHGLQAAASAFEDVVRSNGALLNVPVRVARVNAAHRAGQSPEEAARLARYRALAEMARAEAAARGEPIEVALAHHAHDQLETFLIALARGAGLPGLASMPALQSRLGLRWHRPLLGVSPLALRDWLRTHGVAWCEDPMNANPSYLRSRVRHAALPSLLSVFPVLTTTSARAMRHLAAAQRLLDELAAADLTLVGVPPRIAELQALSEDRQANALRAWLREAHETAASEAQMRTLLRQIRACRTAGHRIDLRVGRGRLSRAGAVLCWTDVAPSGSGDWAVLR